MNTCVFVFVYIYIYIYILFLKRELIHLLLGDQSNSPSELLKAKNVIGNTKIVTDDVTLTLRS
jgi:hypothetical protein